MIPWDLLVIGEKSLMLNEFLPQWVNKHREILTQLLDEADRIREIKRETTVWRNNWFFLLMQSRHLFVSQYEIAQIVELVRKPA